jgi:hypothetical protein
VKHVDAFGGGGHVGTLAHDPDAIRDQRRRIVTVNFVLSGGGEGDVAGHAPWFPSGIELAAEPIGVLADAPPPDVLEVHHEGKFFAIDAVRVVNEPG